jgi:uncharacterized Zn finger protein
MMSDLYRDCPQCGQERMFEQPHSARCPDVADGICPELACTVCGTALIVAVTPPARVPARVRVRAA